MTKSYLSQIPPPTFPQHILNWSSTSTPSYLEDLNVTVANILFVQLLRSSGGSVHGLELHIAVTSGTVLDGGRTVVHDQAWKEGG